MVHTCRASGHPETIKDLRCPNVREGMTEKRGAGTLADMATGGHEQLMFDWDAVPPRPGPLPAVAELKFIS